MAATDEAESGRTGALVAPARWSSIGAALLLASAALQLAASLQRWVVLRDSWSRDDYTIEDHRFDYTYPADPWEPLGTAAQVAGAGYVLLAAGVVAMARGATLRPGRSERALVAVVAGSFGIDGIHAVLSGLLGVPTPWQFAGMLQLVLSTAAAVCLVLLGVRWSRGRWPASVACVFLVGNTVPGYLFAAFTIAPIVTGYQSYDSTPWTETIVAAFTALAALALLAAAALRTAPRV